MQGFQAMLLRDVVNLGGESTGEAPGDYCRFWITTVRICLRASRTSKYSVSILAKYKLIHILHIFFSYPYHTFIKTSLPNGFVIGKALSYNFLHLVPCYFCGSAKDYSQI